MHIFTIISRNNDNQAMKPGQLVSYKLRNIFLEKSYTKCFGETFPRPFSKKSKLAYLWINILKFYFAFIVCQVENYQKGLKWSCRPLGFTSYKAILKKQ